MGDVDGEGDEERVLEAGDVLVREGDPGDELFEVLDGELEILRGGARIDVAGPGATLGEIAVLAGTPRTATVRALRRTVVRPMGRGAYESLASDEQLGALTDTARERVDRHRLIELVEELLGVETSVAAEVVGAGHWTRLAAGEVLFAEGDASDAGYLLVSGRLSVSRDGLPIGEVSRGQVVGEIGLIERAPRSATVVALRDSTMARFDVDAFRALAADHPTLMLQLSRTILARIGRPHADVDRARSVSVTVTAPLDTRLCCTHLADELGRHGTTAHLWAARIDADLGRTGIVESGRSLTVPAVSEYLQEAETAHDYLLLETGDADGRWTRTALGLADRILVVVSAAPSDDEQRRIGAVLAAAPTAAHVERWAAVVHRPDAELPAGSARLAERFGFDRVVHVREGSRGDLARVARLVSGNATGLVLGGGGARGFAHLGVWRALDELGIEIDAIGGASIGAPLGALMAMQWRPAALETKAAEVFHGLLDYTVPVVSLIKGERITRNIERGVKGLDVRDMWRPFFCVSTNLTRSRVQVHDHGDAALAVRASVAIPGILPPVPSGGDLLVDGGVLNNLPCDVMRRAGTVSTLIAVDLTPSAGPGAKDDFGLSVSGWRALRAQVGSGKVRFPGLLAVLMRTMVAGSVRDRDAMLGDGTIDCYLDLELRGVPLLDFERVAEISARGHEAARPRLEAWLAARG